MELYHEGVLKDACDSHDYFNFGVDATIIDDYPRPVITIKETRTERSLEQSVSVKEMPSEIKSDDFMLPFSGNLKKDKKVKYSNEDLVRIMTFFLDEINYS